MYFYQSNREICQYISEHELWVLGRVTGIFLKIFREHIGLAQYDDIKKALRLSSSSIVHKWNQTRINDIEGYATYIEKSAKLVKLMKTFNKVGIALSALNGANSI